MPSRPTTTGGIVHYVEDNETNVEVMRGILAQRPQVQMEVSVTGLDGLAAVRGAPAAPDPARHAPAGHQRPGAAAPPEERPATSPSIPVIVVSADATAPQIDAALDAGAVRYLTKPVDVASCWRRSTTCSTRMDTGFS